MSLKILKQLRKNILIDIQDYYKRNMSKKNKKYRIEIKEDSFISNSGSEHNGQENLCSVVKDKK